MKVKLLILFLVISVCAAAQPSVVPLKGDSIIISKTGGWAELVVRNKTKDTLNGLMINTGNGVMAFKRMRAINDSQFVIGTDTIKIKGVGGAAVGGAGGLSKSGNNVVLGGSALAANASIPTSAFNLSIASSSASGVLTLTATGGPALTATTSVLSAFAINGTSTHLTAGGGGAFSGPTYGATGTSVVGVGIYGQSTSDIGVLGSSTSGTGGSFTLNPSTTSSMDDVLRVTRSSSGTPSVGMGASIAFWLESSTTTAVAGRMGFNWSVTTHAVRTSVFELYTINSGTLARKLKIAGNGLITMDTYIGTAHTGTLHRLAGFDASGNLIMVDTTGFGGGGGGSSDSLATLLNAPAPGEVLLNTDAIDTLLIKRLIAGSNISLVATAYGITISSTGGGGGGGGDSANLIVVNAGVGIQSWFESNDSLYMKRIGSTYALAATTGTDSTWKYTIDTTLIATRAYANSVGGGGGGGGCFTCWTYNALNATGAAGLLGTSDNQDLRISTNNIERLRITNDSNFLWNTTTKLGSSHRWNVQDTANFKGLRVGGILPNLSGYRASLGVRMETTASTDYAIALFNSTPALMFGVTGQGLLVAPLHVSGWTSSLYRGLGSTQTFSASNGGGTTGGIINLSPLTITTGTGSTTTAAVKITGGYNTAVPNTNTGMWTSLWLNSVFDQADIGTAPTASIRIEGALNAAYDYAAIRILDSGSVISDGAWHYNQKKAPATSGNYTVTLRDHFIYLLDLTGIASRTVTMPTPLYEGMELVVYNTSSDGSFKWSFGGASVLDAAGSTITTLTDGKCYVVRYYYGSWRLISVTP